MIFDSSVVVALLLEEPAAEQILARIKPSAELGIGGPTLVESSMVLTARLGFPHCLAYATAKVARKPLLCLGNDFPQTDLDLGL